MAPAVPFALLGVVQLASLATWLGLGAAACFPRLRRRSTPLVVLAALAMAGAEATTALRFGTPSSNALGVVRLTALAILAVGLADGGFQRTTSRPTAPPTRGLPAVLVPLAAKPALAGAGAAMAAIGWAVAAWRVRRPGADRQVAGGLGVGLAFTAVATALAGRAATSSDAALAVLAARGAAAAAFVAVLVLLARSNLLGKVVGAIVAGVVAMAIGAVAVVGTGVAGQVQREQSTRLLSVATAQQSALSTTATRAGLFAKVVALCPTDPRRCVAFLKLFAADPDYFAVVARRKAAPAVVAPNRRALSNSALVQLAGSSVVRAALKRSTTSQTVSSGPVLLDGSRLAVVAAVPVRTSTDSRVAPSFAAVYGIGIVDSYLRTVRASTGYDVSVVVGDRVVASDLGPSARASVLTEAVSAHVSDADPTSSLVVPAESTRPTIAFVPVTAAGNDDARIATLAVSQPASIALAAQRSVLRRLVVTALVVLAIVAAFAFVLAQRIAEPVRRLTVAAGRVRHGELDTRSGVAGPDEVGVLAQSFDAMTASLQTLTGDLRAAADQEAALRSRLETVVGSMTDGLVVTDETDTVTAANPTALQLLGCETGDVVGRSVHDALRLRDGNDNAVLDGVTQRIAVEAVLRRADATEVPVRVAVAPLADGQGRVVMLGDRTREAEVERLKTEFLANVSHELRTPMTPIQGYAELLSRRPGLPPEQAREFVGQILTSTSRMNRVVELLVDVASLDAGRVTPSRREVTAASIVDERLEAWRAAYPQRADDLRRRVARRLPMLDVDPIWLGKALDELADNAVKYTDTGTLVSLVASRTDEGRVRLAVRDGGAGVDTSRLAELLGDFSQADASQTRPVGGLGLGLGFVTRVVDRLGLRLEVTSRPGKGSEFAIDVPAAGPPAG